MTIRLLEKTTEGQHSTPDRNPVERWFGGQCVPPEATEDFVFLALGETQSEQEEWAITSPILVRAVFHTNADFGRIVVSATGAAVGWNAVLNSNAVFSGQMLADLINIWPSAREPRGLTQDSEQLQQYKCRQVLFAFTSHAKEILERKGIAITETRIRNWQAIDDTNWKQCILDLTVKAESHIALSIWDELTEELQKFIGMQPEVDRPFLESSLSLDIKWV